MSKQGEEEWMCRVGPIVVLLRNLPFIRCRMEMLCIHAGAWLLRFWCSSYLVWNVMNHYAVTDSAAAPDLQCLSPCSIPRIFLIINPSPDLPGTYHVCFR